MTDQDGAAGSIVGAFAPIRVLEILGPSGLRRMLGGLAGAGVSHLLTEGRRIPAWLVDEIVRARLQLGGGVACFSDHGESPAPVPEALRPVTASGAVRPRMEWYRGIIPTDRRYEEALVEVVEEAVGDLPGDLFVLDFIRWPIHWEIELRDDEEVVDSSFDPMTLKRFRDEMGVDVPDDPSRAAATIQSSLEPHWTEFKCRVIDAVTGRIAAAVRRRRPDIVLGAYIVPGTDGERRRYAGQDVSTLGEHLDVLLPMTYHAIVHRPVSWVGEVVSDVSRRGSRPVVPVVQATADPEVSAPYDWGGPFPPEELGAAIDAGLDAGGRGFVVFPAHGLDERRLGQLPPRVARVTGTGSPIRSSD